MLILMNISIIIWLNIINTTSSPLSQHSNEATLYIEHPDTSQISDFNPIQDCEVCRNLMKNIVYDSDVNILPSLPNTGEPGCLETSISNDTSSIHNPETKKMNDEWDVIEVKWNVAMSLWNFYKDNNLDTDKKIWKSAITEVRCRLEDNSELENLRQKNEHDIRWNNPEELEKRRQLQIGIQCIWDVLVKIWKRKVQIYADLGRVGDITESVMYNKKEWDELCEKCEEIDDSRSDNIFMAVMTKINFVLPKIINLEEKCNEIKKKGAHKKQIDKVKEDYSNFKLTIIPETLDCIDNAKSQLNEYLSSNQKLLKEFKTFRDNYNKLKIFSADRVRKLEEIMDTLQLNYKYMESVWKYIEDLKCDLSLFDLKHCEYKNFVNGNKSFIENEKNDGIAKKQISIKQFVLDGEHMNEDVLKDKNAIIWEDSVLITDKIGFLQMCVESIQERISQEQAYVRGEVGSNEQK